MATSYSTSSPYGCVLLVINVLGALLLLWVSKPCDAMFLSIDCGASTSYTDSNSIEWVGDDEYVHSGKSEEVAYSVRPLEISTLRVFSSLRKNCYTVPVSTGDKILVRAGFYYGNYDGKNSPPTFDLYFDSNFWTYVNITAADFNTIVYYEVIYTVQKKNTTSICLAQTLPHQLPFISTLEFRSLAPTMYALVDSDHALFRRKRYAFGATRLIRYPDDAYDRRWNPASGLSPLIEVKGEAESIDVSEAEDKPPAAVLQNATTGIGPGTNGTIKYIQLFFTDLPDYEIPVYITLFFSEVIRVTSADKRSFQFLVDNEPYSKAIVPPFGGVVEVAISNINASSKTSFILKPTSDSTLPVLINAIEVYRVSEVPLSSATDVRDVEALALLQVQFEVLIIWSGDPCLPSLAQWEWIQCSTALIPRVIALNLSSFGLIGTLPDFSSMDALVTIDLHDNSLSGPIPAFLGSFPNLKRLDLSDNRFNGTIPASLSKNKNLELVVTGNCLSGMSCPPPPQTPPDTPPSSTPSGSRKTPPPPPIDVDSTTTSPPSPPEFGFSSAPTHSINIALLSLLLAPTIFQALIMLILT